MLQVKELPRHERPRERLLQSGPLALNDTDLLAVLIGAGTKGRDVFTLAQTILPLIDRAWPNLEAAELEKIAGIGSAKAAQLLAALEFARRRIRPEGVKIKEPGDVVPLVQHLADRKQEHFTCTTLNGAHEVIKTRIVTIGLVNAAQVHPREVYSDAIADRAVAVIVAHNHPSGQLEPSSADLEVTQRLSAAGEILGIRLLDHLIFSRAGFYSFQQHGKLR
ncbi:MAG: DNA repair protein RadC [Oligoflexia bacterium]|nr:DNA repair protein RadC [Oligoflexia bacterium]